MGAAETAAQERRVIAHELGGLCGGHALVRPRLPRCLPNVFGVEGCGSVVCPCTAWYCMTISFAGMAVSGPPVKRSERTSVSVASARSSDAGSDNGFRMPK
jgi:hypothetical protein